MVRYLTVAYLALVVYASLYPFSGWRVPSAEVAAFVFADWPLYVTAADVILNILAYLPLGLLLTLVFMGGMRRLAAASLGVVAGSLVSLLLELTQVYLPTRIPSNVDLLTNTGGTLLGAALSYAFGERWVLSGELYRLRGHFFRPGAATDIGFLLVALWLLTQLNAEIWLFGNGDLRHLVPEYAAVRYSAEIYRFLEAGVAALNYAGVAFMLTAIAQSAFAAGIAMAALTLAALALKSVASAALFVPGNPTLWLTTGSIAGLAAGIVAWLLLARLSSPALIRAAAICLTAGLVLVNLAPENPYLVAALQVWRHGYYLSFNGMTRLLSTLWPFAALAYLFYMTGRHAGDGKTERPRGAT